MVDAAVMGWGRGINKDMAQTRVIPNRNQSASREPDQEHYHYRLKKNQDSRKWEQISRKTPSVRQGIHLLEKNIQAETLLVR